MRSLLMALALMASPAWAQDTDCGVGFPPQACEEAGIVGGVTPTPSPPEGIDEAFFDAEAYWQFDVPTDQGLDRVGGKDLTPVNSPLSTGGALGYAAEFNNTAITYAFIADPPDLDTGPGVSWGFVQWVHSTTADGNQVTISKGGGAVEGHYDGLFVNTTTWRCRFHDGSSLKTDDFTVTANVRGMVMCRYDATTNALEAGVDGVWSGSPTPTVGDGADTTEPFHISTLSNAAFGMDGAVGQTLFYRSASGGEVLTDAFATSLYNSNKGKTCAATTETANLTHCWDMSENGGPYVDSVGPSDLTGNNTPTRAAGMVEQPNSGMSTGRVSELLTGSGPADAHYSLSAPTGLDIVDLSTGFTAAFWQFMPIHAANSYLWQVGNADADKNYQWNASVASTRPGWVVYGDVTNASLTMVAADAPVGQWNYCFARFNPATDQAEARCNDGPWRISPAASTSLIDGSAQDFWIMRRGSVNSGGFRGNVDSLAIWHEYKSDQFVEDLWNGGAGTW